METEVTLTFGLTEQEAKDIGAELLKARRVTDARFKGCLTYAADLMREIANQLPSE